MSLISPTAPEIGVANRVKVRAPARLHMGFLDLNGGLGRRFGSIGLALDLPSTALILRPAATCAARGPDAGRALDYAGRILEQWGLGGGVDIEVAAAIPSHAGLGSGTQMCLALIEGIARLFDVAPDLTQTAAKLGRGARSGIGVGAFTIGGFLIDGGRGAANSVPPVVARASFPDHWRVLLVLDRTRQGVHGPEERTAFARLPTFSARDSERLCRLALMQMLPALAEADIVGFGTAVAEVQRCVGAHFASVQGGVYSSSTIARVMSWLSERGAVSAGQSSWGPTGFALFESEAGALRALEEARGRWAEATELEFHLCRARNTPAEIEIEPVACDRTSETRAYFEGRQAGMS